MIKIAADSQIVNIEQNLIKFFADEYSLQFFESDQLNSKDLTDVDALLVRSTILVDKDLCANSQIKFVGSATSGINHLDTQYLFDQNISWSHAPGCNACSVAHYVMAALGELIQENFFNISESVGIIGYGNIGKRLYQILSSLNIEVYACDPFLQDAHLVNLDKVLACDLVTIHVPYSTEGAHPTSGLINQSHKNALKDKILINTSRGGIVSEDLVLELQDLIYIADVWIDEPIPSIPIIQKAFISTPHIAGYSIEGKLNGAIMIAKECARFFNCLKDNDHNSDPLADWPYGIENIVHDLHTFGFPLTMFNSELNLKFISNVMKNIPANKIADSFEDLRINHSPRHDFNAYSYEAMVNLDESIKSSFFNSLKNF